MRPNRTDFSRAYLDLLALDELLPNFGLVSEQEQGILSLLDGSNWR
jgi:hypothetical protein